MLSQHEINILARLNIKTEAEAIGIEFTGTVPNGNGWLACRALGRQDRNPSAALNVSNGPMRGLYRDLGDQEGKASDFFSLAVLTGRFHDRDCAVRYFSSVVGIEFTEGSNSKKTPITEQVIWLQKSEEDRRLQELWSGKKPGIVPAALQAFGAQKCAWPRNQHPINSIICWTFAGRRPGSHALEAILLYRADGEDFPSVGNLPVRKTHLVKGSHDSWLWPGDDVALERAEVILKVEGPTDAMAIWPLLPGGWSVLTNLAGAAANPGRLPMQFARDKLVLVVGDTDRSGQAGARHFAKEFVKHAREVRLLRLPYEITASHGKDLRDWINEGHSFAEFQALVNDAEVVTLPVTPARSEKPGGHDSNGGKEACTAVVEDDDDPHRLARGFLTVCYGCPESPNLRFWRDDFWIWRTPAFRILPRGDLRARLARTLKEILDAI